MDELDPIESLFAVLTSAFIEGIPEIEGRVDVMRSEPVWGEDELPIILLDLDSDRLEAISDAPLRMKHTQGLDIIIYCRGSSRGNRMTLTTLIRRVRSIMREWQFIDPTDVVADSQQDTRVIEEIRPGDSIDYFSSTDGDMDHRGARLAYQAIFVTSDSSQGKALAGAPPRNRLAEFYDMNVDWVNEVPPYLHANDQYSVREP